MTCPKNVTRYCIYGAGGHARELADIVTGELGDGAVVALVDDFHSGYHVASAPVLDFEAAATRFASVAWLIGIGDPLDRRKLSEKVAARGLTIGSFVSSRAFISRQATLEAGTQIYPHAVVSSNTRLGRGCIVNYNATLSHDCIIGDWVTVCPGANVAGHVHAGEGVFIGIGARILPGSPDLPLVIGEHCMIGGGATVTQPVGAASTVAGTPAKPIGAQP